MRTSSRIGILETFHLESSPTTLPGGIFQDDRKAIKRPLPRPSDGNNNILVAMDYFTKWPEAYPIPDQED
ncbi:hypothetical protein TNCV_490821 [Trichonephila clavipes]|nr:hypothetical protein TNCV_490821 [Trichonephila clavipes]